MNKKKLGLGSAISTGVGLVVATSCLVSLGQGAGSVGAIFIIPMILACLLNMIAAASLSELNGLMPNLTGGLAQYSLAGVGPFWTIITMVGGYLICNCLPASVEGAMFGNAMQEITGWNISPAVFSLLLTLVLTIVNLRGVDMFAKVQNLVAYGLIGSMVIMGLIGCFGLGTGQVVEQPANVSTNIQDVAPMLAVAFWLFIGVEFVIPIGKDLKNPRKQIPWGMFLSLAIICVMQIFVVLGFQKYTPWSDLAESGTPHILYGVNLLGNTGRIWMAIVAILAAVSTQNSTFNSLSKICYGMSKIEMMPEIFQKTNKHGCPYVGIIMIDIILVILEATGLSTADQMMFIILVGSMFWMACYMMAHINVLVLRKRMPNAPRSFKCPLGPVLPIIGIIGVIYMMYHIDGDPTTAYQIWAVTAALFVFLAVYAAVWIKTKMKVPMFQSFSLEKVMAMENDLYYPTHKAYRMELKKKEKRKQELRDATIV